ncbi:pyridoxal-phosphate dependent enzyme [Pectinatus haikarae]|uniref:Threonine synthase n=1 Tax=Pectinatus haikarae TaxID=349096 RepID=A0ABT9YAY8_9FIRM|nr:pyridoxal-phosphate dependent enzyme [Pectinatus haikarae]MDQ0204994.1 threonine synthase [Pectinatus haikarae]
MNFVCSDCGHKESAATYKAKCDKCGGLWKLDYTAPKFDLEKIDKDTWNIFRYREFMPVEGDSWRNISLGEGMTPIINFDDDVLFKMDYYMPTLSFKDRGAAVLISHCHSIGVKGVVQDSSGNAGDSVAAYCGRAGINCEIFVPDSTSPKKVGMIRAHGAVCNVIQGSRDDCANVCRAKVEKEGGYYANHVYNPFFYEGTKTYIYEVYEQLKKIPENIIVPLGNGTLLIGVIKALEEFLSAGIIDKMPKIIAVQSEACAPFVEAVKRKSAVPVQVQVKPTLAEGIAVGIPMRGKEILEYIYKYDITVLAVPEEMILPTRGKLAAKGIFCEHTTAVSYAAYQLYCKQFGKMGKCLIPMCGAGLKSEPW